MHCRGGLSSEFTVRQRDRHIGRKHTKVLLLLLLLGLALLITVIVLLLRSKCICIFFSFFHTVLYCKILYCIVSSLCVRVCDQSMIGYIVSLISLLVHLLMILEILFLITFIVLLL